MPATCIHCTMARLRGSALRHLLVDATSAWQRHDGGTVTHHCAWECMAAHGGAHRRMSCAWPCGMQDAWRPTAACGGAW
eukprot:356113-Chlamydomonas_euryale.AAC.3